MSEEVLLFPKAHSNSLYNSKFVADEQTLQVLVKHREIIFHVKPKSSNGCRLCFSDYFLHGLLLFKSNCYSSFTKLWQSCSDPHPKISPIAIFAFYSLNYSLVARLQDNSRPKSPTKIETEKITAIYCLWMVDNKRGRESGSEQIKM